MTAVANADENRLLSTGQLNHDESFAKRCTNSISYIVKAALVHIKVSAVKSKHHIPRSTWLPRMHSIISINIQPNAAQFYRLVLSLGLIGLATTKLHVVPANYHDKSVFIF